jgi:hypothetical protein
VPGGEQRPGHLEIVELKADWLMIDHGTIDGQKENRVKHQKEGTVDARCVRRALLLDRHTVDGGRERHDAGHGR